MLKIPIMQLDAQLPLPARQHQTDAGYDLVAAHDALLAPGERALIATGIAVAVPRGFAALVLPRSGLACNHGVTVLNTPGLVDSGYRGELKVILINLDPREKFVLRRGDRIAQLVIQSVEDVSWQCVERLPESDRGTSGHGSTGV